jgi:hypothetical protein
MKIEQPGADLFQVVLALGAVGRLADPLDGGQQQRDQDADDGDHHEQLDQREATPVPGIHGLFLPMKKIPNERG